MVERWNIGLQKDISHFNFIVNPVSGGTLTPTLHYPLRAVRSTLRPGSQNPLFSPRRRRYPTSRRPLFQYSIIPIVSEANLYVLVIEHWNLKFICNLVLGIWELVTVRHRFINTYEFWSDIYSSRTAFPYIVCQIPS
jgi:hypothetical protein